MEQKLCKTCGELKPIDEFPWRNKQHTSRKNKCYSCLNQYAREHYRKDIDKSREQGRLRRSYYRNKDIEIYRSKENEYRKNNPDKVKNRRLMHTYGITIEEWNDMYDKQLGLCACCGKKLKNPHIDHEHLPGYSTMPPEQKRKYIRGLVCMPCNRFLICKNNWQTIQDVYEYLERYENDAAPNTPERKE